MLNLIWAGFFIAAFISACWQAFIGGNVQIWNEMSLSLFSSAKAAFEICLNLTGILCLWLGLLKIAEVSGMINGLSKALYPFFKRIMPEVPENHPALSSIIMNMAANMLGLDNAATPMGLKAMEQLQELNPKKDTASNAQIMFMVINASAVTLLPITILMYRSELGSVRPAAVFIPILLATSVSTLAGFFSVALVQKLNIFNTVVLSYLLGFLTLLILIAYGFFCIPAEKRLDIAATAGNFIIFAFVVLFIFYGLCKKINVYDTFINGAKEGFDIAIRIIPYLVAMLTAIAMLRTSGVVDACAGAFSKLAAFMGIDNGFVPALPTAFIKPLSGSGARAMMIETMQTYGADSFPAFVSCIVQGSTETTFYVLAVYFGAVKISKVRSALPCALIADAAGIAAAILFAYAFY